MELLHPGIFLGASVMKAFSIYIENAAQICNTDAGTVEYQRLYSLWYSTVPALHIWFDAWTLVDSVILHITLQIYSFSNYTN